MNKRILLLLVFILQISLFHYIFALAESPKNYLKGKFYHSVKDHFLIATEKMIDSRFKETVIVMLENDKNGAWGLVINKRRNNANGFINRPIFKYIGEKRKVI